MTNKTEIAVIGAGASGLVAAIAAKNENTSVTLYEKEKRVGRKILATGNGRCNMTNMNASQKNYHGENVNFMEGVIRRFWVQDTLSFFEELGILWKEEENGKVYPYSDTASSVLDVLRRKTDKLGINTFCEFNVKSVKRTDSGFIVESKDGRKAKCDKVIVAAGGKASPSLGSDGSGYELLKAFGHSVTGLSPSLVQIKTETETVRKLKGIKVQANVTIGDRCERGELLFTDYGISGPPVFYLSAYLYNNKYVNIDIMPEYDFDTLYNMICMRCGYLYDVPLEDFFDGMINKRVGQALLKYAGVAPLSRKASSLSQKEIKSVTNALKNLKLKIEGTASWNNAQVTKGGVRVDKINPATMESKLVKDLYICGEILDIDGDCGGYNLQWAWSSGYIAGQNCGSVKT